jgi:Asp/Glu/hydantoin racemase
LNGIVKGGQNIYGYDIGVLMLDSTFPRICGDIGNARTWDFPVLYKKVEGGTPKKVVLELTSEDIQPFIEGAKELEAAGVKAITTSCGFLALFQEELSNSVSIPVFTSALLFVPMLSRMLGKNKKIGILTANKKTLTQQHLKAVGIENIPCKIVGLEEGEMFTSFTVQNRDYVDIEVCRKELTEAARELTRDGDIGIVVLECTNMPPYTKDIQEAVGLPVFDIVMLTNMFYRAMNPENFR